MRMTLRGFKDQDADVLATFSATGARLSQRIIVSEAVTRGFAMAALDVKKVCLKGVTYKESAEEPKEPMREVNFELS